MPEAAVYNNENPKPAIYIERKSKACKIHLKRTVTANYKVQKLQNTLCINNTYKLHWKKVQTLQNSFEKVQPLQYIFLGGPATVIYILRRSSHCNIYFKTPDTVKYLRESWKLAKSLRESSETLGEIWSMQKYIPVIHVCLVKSSSFYVYWHVKILKLWAWDEKFNHKQKNSDVSIMT